MLLLLASPFLVRLAFRYAVRAFCHVHDVPRRHPFWVEVEPEADDEAPPSPSKSVKVAPLYEETPVLRFEPATTPRDLPAPTDAWSPSTTTTTRDRPAPAAEPELSTTTLRDRPAPAAEPEPATTTRDRPAPAASRAGDDAHREAAGSREKYAKKMIKQRYEKKFAELRRKQAAVEERLRRERASRDKCSQALDTVNDIAQEAKSGAVAPGRVSMLEMLGIGEGEAKEAADAAGGDAQKAEPAARALQARRGPSRSHLATLPRWPSSRRCLATMALRRAAAASCGSVVAAAAYKRQTDPLHIFWDLDHTLLCSHATAAQATYTANVMRELDGSAFATVTTRDGVPSCVKRGKDLSLVVDRSDRSLLFDDRAKNFRPQRGRNGVLVKPYDRAATSDAAEMLEMARCVGIAFSARARRSAASTLRAARGGVFQSRLPGA
ncbi:phosphatase [Aureococcus anophagefferens]|nr:phosphatase [Aureococcus anophagefferens]